MNTLEFTLSEITGGRANPLVASLFLVVIEHARRVGVGDERGAGALLSGDVSLLATCSSTPDDKGPLPIS